VRIRRSASQAAAQVSEFPRTLAAVRGAPDLALNAGPSAIACNLWHEPVGLSLLERCLLPLLDGEHSHESLASHLAVEARAERLRFIKDEKPLTDPAALREFTQHQVALALRDLRRKALLAG
jgi:methyltransferase-like protein